MKKIAIYLNSLARGGAEKVTINLSKYLVNAGVKCVIITEVTKKNEYDVPKGVTRIDMNIKGNKFLHYICNIFKMRKILKNEKPDILLAMDLSSCLLAIPSTRNLDVKVVVSERNDPNHFPGKKIVQIVSRIMMKKATGYVFQTNEVKDFYKKIVGDRGVVIPNPLLIDELPKEYLDSKAKEIVNVGRLSEQKNQKLLIDSFYKINKEFPEYKLVIYGEGNLKNQLADYVNELGISDKVDFPGNKKNVLENINRASIFVLSSNYEGMPNALIESMAIGLPCISTDCSSGGPRYLIENNVNGILIPVGDVDSLTKSLAKILDNSTFADKIATNAKKIRKKLDSNKICKEWEKYLNSL